ncbi:MAG: substrate-binding domain-containing protein [Myxococcota bacterium]|jgi:tungstate transport system substrate-binding protein
MPVKIKCAALAAMLSVCMASTGLHAADKTAPKQPSFLILATTTSVYDTGLLDKLLPIFKAETGWTIKPLAVGTGEALRMGEQGEADILVAHAPADEQKFMTEGKGCLRLQLMRNFFLIAGPKDDPAGIKGMTDPVEAFKKIAAMKQPFVSRGDNSGTHKKEKELWAAAGGRPAWDRYVETGAGMSVALNIADQKNAYILTDEGTYKNIIKNLKIVPLIEGGDSLTNRYSVIAAKGKNTCGDTPAEKFARFMLSDKVQAIIKTWGVEKQGRPMFIPEKSQ